MAVDYSTYKTVAGDTQYATKINNFMTAVQDDMNAKLDTSAVTFGAISTVTANYTVQAVDQTLEVNAVTAAVTVTLPAAGTNTGRKLTFRRVDSTAYTVNLGNVSTLDLQNEIVTLESNGTAWVKVN